LICCDEHIRRVEGERRTLARLRWRCRRGMRELDVLMTRYLERRYPQADAAERAAFERLLELPDPLIMSMVTGRQAATEPELADVVARLTHPEE